jgi:hypothetical protein
MRSLISWIVVLLLTVPCETLAQSQSHDWTQVSHLKALDEIVVVPMAGRTTKGKFESFNEDGIVLSGGVRIERNLIRRIYLVGGRPYGKSIAVGIAVGGGTGAVVGAASGGCKPGRWCFISRQDAALILAVLGVAVGAIGGAVWSLTHHNRALIYER